MKIHAIAALTAMVLTATITSCDGHKAATFEYPPVHVADIYRSMADYAGADSAARAAILATDTTELAAFCRVVSDGAPSADAVELWSRSLPVAIFTPTVDSVYASTDTLAQNIGTILGRAAAAGIELPERRYAAVVYGRHESVLFVDSVMLIALNHYLGQEYPGYSHWPVYMRFNKAPQYMPYDIAEALVATEFPYSGGDNATVLSRMLYEGALTAAKLELVGEDAEPMYALGYRLEQYRFLTDEEGNLWRTAVGHRLIFDTSAATASQLVDVSPATRLLDERAPGRAGRFLGWRIVESYRRAHPEATLPFLLSPEFYNSPDVLTQAGYSPANS